MTPPGELSLSIDVAGVTIELRSNGAAFHERVRRIVHPFLSSRNADYRIGIRFTDTPMPVGLEWLLFNLHSVDALPRAGDDIARLVRRTETSLEVEVTPEVFDFDSPNRPRLLNVLLCAAFNTVWERLRRSERRVYLMHGCGVVEGGRAWLFTGPSGSGKTTIASLAGEREVLNDETVSVGLDEGGDILIGGTPFLGGVERNANAAAPLGAVLSVEHGPRTDLERLQGGASFWGVMSQLLQTAPVLPARDEHQRSVALRAEVASRVASLVPVYRMPFVPDETLWQVVRDLDEAVPREAGPPGKREGR